MLEELKKQSVIAMCETWNQTSEVSLPKELKDFEYFCSPAVKDKSRGRASGGLLFMYRKPFRNAVVLEATPWWLSVKLQLGDNTLIVVIVYFPPSVQFDDLLNQWADMLIGLKESFGNLPVFVLGDFNVRIGDLGPLPSDLLPDSSLRTIRRSLDVTINRKGRELLEEMHGFPLILINGRTDGDSQGEFTHLEIRQEELCCSVLDLAFVNIPAAELVSDFMVKEQYTSDHRMCEVTLNLTENTATSHAGDNQACEIYKTEVEGGAS